MLILIILKKCFFYELREAKLKRWADYLLKLYQSRESSAGCPCVSPHRKQLGVPGKIIVLTFIPV